MRNSKIYKISGYVIDVHGEYNERSVEFLINQYSDLSTKHFKVESADIGEWYDEHPLNYRNSDIYECEKYFKTTTIDDSTCMINNIDGHPFIFGKTKPDAGNVGVANGMRITEVIERTKKYEKRV